MPRGLTEVHSDNFHIEHSMEITCNELIAPGGLLTTQSLRRYRHIRVTGGLSHLLKVGLVSFSFARQESLKATCLAWRVAVSEICDGSLL